MVLGLVLRAVAGYADPACHFGWNQFGTHFHLSLTGFGYGKVVNIRGT